jgi:tetratricopeptide (TPR) repeat protein
LAYFRKSIDEIAFIPNGAAFIRKRATEDTAGLIAQAEAYAEQTGKAIHWVRVADFIQRKGGSAAQAEIAARKATELVRQFPQATKIASQAYVALSRAQSAGGKAEEAIRSATQATELVPEDAPTLHHLGQLLFEQQAYKAAATAFQKAVEASDTHFPSYKSLSMALQRQKDLPGARSALTRGMAVSRGGPWSDIFKKALSELEPIGTDQAGS